MITQNKMLDVSNRSPSSASEIQFKLPKDYSASSLESRFLIKICAILEIYIPKVH